MEATNEELSHLLGLANDFRAAKGGEQLNEIPKSVPRSSYNCIIANAFNFGCIVGPNYIGGKGYIVFRSKEDRETYCKLTGEKEINGHYYPENTYTAELSDELNIIATRFDYGQYESLIEDGYESRARVTSSPL